MADTSLTALPSRDFGHDQAAHLLARAGFGGPPRQVQTLVDMGFDKAVDHLVDFEQVPDDTPVAEVDPDIIRPLNDEERRLAIEARRTQDAAALSKLQQIRIKMQAQDRAQMAQVGRWWLQQFIATARPMQEKLVLLWHNHFASNYRTVRDSNLMYMQNMFFRKHAAGSFADLAHGIIRDPAMIRFLDNNTNRVMRPNENLARELMELFTLGEGNYTEQDIKEGARALTGYQYNDNTFSFNRRNHDAGDKTILGRTGKFDGDDFVNILIEQAACARFIAWKLYDHFVADVPYEKITEHRDANKVILTLAVQLRDARYELKPVLRTLFRSRHFYDAAVRGQKIKSPVQLVVGSVRMLDAPTREPRVLTDSLRMMGQELFNPPSVAGWDGGRAWINTSTLFIRQNIAAYLIAGKIPGSTGWNRDALDYDPTRLLADLPDREPTSVVNHLIDTLLLTPVAPERRKQLHTFMKERDQGITKDSLVALLLLITSMPEYQLT